MLSQRSPFEALFDESGSPRFTPESVWEWEEGAEIWINSNRELSSVHLTLRARERIIQRPRVIAPTDNGWLYAVDPPPTLSPEEREDALLLTQGRSLASYRLELYFKTGEAITTDGPEVVLLPSSRPRSPRRQLGISPPRPGGALAGPLDLDDPAGLELLRGIQCNILKSHGRQFARFLMLRFRDDTSVESRRAFVSAAAREYLTSAFDQKESTVRRDGSKGEAPRGQTLGAIGVSLHGYVSLGLALDADVGQTPEYLSSSAVPTDPEFLWGLTGVSRRYAYWRLPQDDWEQGYRVDGSRAIDVVFLLADDDMEKLSRRVADLRALSDGVAAVVAEESGRKYSFRSRPNEVVEHFGFTDGISQPTFFAHERKKVSAAHWGPPPSPLGTVLVEEGYLPGVSSNGPTYGSYAAFLKMEQDVSRFHKRAEELADRLDVSVERVKALAVGRYANGDPVHTGVGADQNDFNFDVDGCPAHSHIRTMNRREEQAFRMVRRGMNYGPEVSAAGDESSAPDSGGESGLLFLSYQSSVRRFSARMEAALSPRHGGVDAVIGSSRTAVANPARSCPGQPNGSQTWVGKNNKEVCFLMADHVTIRGGGYFFFPSVPFFGNLTKANIVKRHGSHVGEEPGG